MSARPLRLHTPQTLATRLAVLFGRRIIPLHPMLAKVSAKGSPSKQELPPIPEPPLLGAAGGGATRRPYALRCVRQPTRRAVPDSTPSDPVLARIAAADGVGKDQGGAGGSPARDGRGCGGSRWQQRGRGCIPSPRVPWTIFIDPPAACTIASHGPGPVAFAAIAR